MKFYWTGYVISMDDFGLHGRLFDTGGDESFTGEIENKVEETSQGNIIYVDGRLSAPCTDGTYSIALRSCGSGTDGNAYPHPQDVASLAQPGDNILIREGTYTPQGDRVLSLTKSGSEGNPITFQAYNGENAILDGQGSVDIVVYLQFSNYTNLVDLTITNSVPDSSSIRSGIRVRGSSYVLIDNCKVFNHVGTSRNTGEGIKAEYQLTNLTIRNCDIYTNTKGIVIGTEGFRTTGNPADATIEHNYVHDNFITYDTNGNSDGIASIGEGNDGTIIRNNVIRGNGDDGIDVGQGAGFHIIENNVVYNHPTGIGGDGSGIKLGTHGRGYLPRGGFLLRNNVIFNNKIGVGGSGAYWQEDEQFPYPHPNFAYNNVVFNSSQDGYYFESEDTILGNNIAFNTLDPFWDVRGRITNTGISPLFESDYNLLEDRWIKDDSGNFLGDGIPQGEPLWWDQNSLSDNPLFVDSQNHNVIVDLDSVDFGDAPGFHLQTVSPAIDNGADMRIYLLNILTEVQTTNRQNVNVQNWEEAIAFFLNNIPDPFSYSGVAPDIGAYEFSTGNAFCGNNQKEEGEVCDGNDFDGATCLDYGYEYGFLTCSSDCLTINISNCVEEIDNDGDYQDDSWEIAEFGDLSETWFGDNEGDNVINLHEYYFRTDPKRADTETNGDGISDFDEIFVYHSDPTWFEGDRDRLPDFNEVNNYNTLPFTVDTDGDGYEDGDEVDNGLNPLVRDALSFKFIDENGVEHVRTREGLNYIDGVEGKLDAIPWLEMGDRNTLFEGRDEILYEITKKGIVSWARAGATKVGVVGAYAWIKDLDSAPGYQNPYVDELKQLGEQNGVEVIFGMKLASSFITSYDQFFQNGNAKFTELRDIINGITQHTGTNEFILEGESPYQKIVDAYYKNQFDLNEQDMQAFRDNFALLAQTNAKIYNWAPFFYVDENGNPKTIPVDRSNKREDLEGIYTQLLININSVLGDNYGYLGAEDDSFVRAGQREKPYRENAVKIFKALEREGIYNYYQHKPVSTYLSRGPGSILDAGPSELNVDLPRYYGKDLDNSNFRHLPFDKIFLYPGASRFDLVGESVGNYFNNDILVSVRPYDSISEGQPIRIVFEVHDELNRDLNLRLDFYDPEKGITPDRDVPNIEIDEAKNQLKFLWIPEYHRGKDGKGFYWLEFIVTDESGQNLIFGEEGNEIARQFVRIEVDNYGINSLTTDNADFDSDGFGNKDERDNENNPRDVEDSPRNDFDLDFISDLNDINVDNDAANNDNDACPYTSIEHRRNTNKFGCPIPEISEFDDEFTTDLYEEDLFNVRDLKIGKKDLAQVRFSEDIQLLRQENRNGRDTWVPVDLASNVRVEQNLFSVDSDSLPELDKRAEISFYNINFVNPIILKEGKKCEDCDILSYSNGELIVGVVGFSTYEVADGGASICGNGIVESGEQCDDGNLIGGDGCDANCQTESSGNNGGNGGGGSGGGSGGGGGSSGGGSGGGWSGLEGDLICQDGIDNDEDGFTDYPEDDGCTDILDTSEEGSVGNSCVEDWNCGEWKECVNGLQTRSCIDENSCGTLFDKPVDSKICFAFGEKDSQKFLAWVLAVSILILGIVISAIIHERRKRHVHAAIHSPLMRHGLK